MDKYLNKMLKIDSEGVNKDRRLTSLTRDRNKTQILAPIYKVQLNPHSYLAF